MKRVFSAEHRRKISEARKRCVPRPLIMRFWSKVQITPSCWLWQASNNGTGYGKIQKDGRLEFVHRVSYELFVGPIPEGLQIDHLCRVRNCVNPEHLEPVTHAENMARGSYAQKTHCPQGHPYDEVNTYRTKTGSRLCATCQRKRALDRYYAQRGHKAEA